jgi:hypothetical protein
MITILNPPKLETTPTVIVRTSKVGEAYNSETKPHPGTFARVTLKTAKDWLFIRLLQHGEDYFAPASGDGLLVKAELLKA